MPAKPEDAPSSVELNACGFDEMLGFLLTEEPLDFSPIPDLPHEERPLNIRSSSSPEGESAEFSAKVDSDGFASEQLGSKRQRSKSSQAEAQRRYRERKKNKMAELEETVSKLRAKISALESGSARETSPVDSVEARKSDSGDSSFGVAPLEHFSLDAKALCDTAAPDDVPFVRLSEVLASRSANDANPKEARDCVALALEAGDALRRRVNGPSAGGSFKSFAEVELWFGSMQDAYDLTVEKLSAQLRLGVSDEEIRETIGEVNSLFVDARNSRPELSAVTATQSTIQMCKDAAGNEDVLSQCSTSCAIMAKSVVDRKLMAGDWPKIVKRILAELPPKDIEAIITWGDEFFETRKQVLLRRMQVLMRNENGDDAVKQKDKYFNVPIEQLRARRGELAEMHDELFSCLKDELRLHHEGTCELFNRLSARSAAKIIVESAPTALDPFSLANELKKVKFGPGKSLDIMTLLGIARS